MKFMMSEQVQEFFEREQLINLTIIDRYMLEWWIVLRAHVSRAKYPAHVARLHLIAEGA